MSHDPTPDPTAVIRANELVAELLAVLARYGYEHGARRDPEIAAAVCGLADQVVLGEAS